MKGEGYRPLSEPSVFSSEPGTSLPDQRGPSGTICKCRGMERMSGGAPTTGTTTDRSWFDAPRFPLAHLTRFAASLLVAMGVPPRHAGPAAEFLLLADLRGVDSHGVARLPFYAARFRRGLIDAGAELRVLREGPSTLAFDAGDGFGLTQAPRAMERCIDKAEETGICLATVGHSNHFGIAGAYALMAARRGLGGMAMTNASTLVVPTFGTQPMLGTNPIAIAVPTSTKGTSPPLVLDMSTSAVAWGKIEIARRAGSSIPLGWAVDDGGVPTTDPFAARWLTPLGGARETSGHKGYGLGVVVDILCGPLAGAAWGAHVLGSRGPDRPANVGHTFMAWRIDAFRDPEEFFADLAAMLAELRATPPAPGHEGTGVLVPGDPEIRAESVNRRLGVPVRPPVVEELRTLAGELGVPCDLDVEASDS